MNIWKTVHSLCQYFYHFQKLQFLKGYPAGLLKFCRLMLNTDAQEEIFLAEYEMRIAFSSRIRKTEF